MTLLPPELIDIITEQAALDDDAFFSSMKQCSLVCHRLVGIAQKHIFQKIRLQQGPINARCPYRNIQHHRPIVVDGLSTTTVSSRRERLHSLLHDSPHLGEYVTTLIIDDIIPKPRAPCCDREDTFLPVIISSLPNLTSLSIKWLPESLSHMYPASIVPWLMLSATFRSQIHNILLQRRLTSLSITGFQDFPVGDVLGCPTITELYLCTAGGAVLTKSSLSDTSSDDRVLSLTCAQVCVGTKDADLFASPHVDLANLRRLELTVSFNETTLSTQTILQKCSSSLEELYFAPEALSVSRHSFLSVSLPRLKEITFVFYFLVSDLPDIMKDRGLAQFINHGVSHPHVLETIKLDLCVEAQRVDTPFPSVARIREDKLSSLKRVDVSFYRYTLSKSPPNERSMGFVADAIRTMMPWADEAGLIRWHYPLSSMSYKGVILD